MKKIIIEFLEQDIKTHPIFSHGDKNYVFINLRYFNALTEVFNCTDEEIINIVCDYLTEINYELKYIGVDNLFPKEFINLFNANDIHKIDVRLITFIENNISDILDWAMVKGEKEIYKLLVEYKEYAFLY